MRNKIEVFIGLLIVICMSAFTACSHAPKLMKNCSTVGKLESGDALSECSDL